MNEKFAPWSEPNIELDPAFAERDRLRKAGQPVEIARTGRLLIRETIRSDVPDLYKIRCQPGMDDHAGPVQPTLEEELVFMEAYIRHMYRFYDFGLWTVLEQDSDRIVGRAGLFPSRLLKEGVELGYMIAPDRRRRGYAAECGRAILCYAFDVLDLPELHILIDIENQISIRVAERLGFLWQEQIQNDHTEYIHMVCRSLSGSGG